MTRRYFKDHVFNLNSFKKIAGAFGLCTHSSDGAPCAPGIQVQLINSANTVVQSATTDQDGFFALVYKHTGKAAPYTVKLGAPYNWSTTATLKANGWASVTFDVDTHTATSETACGGNPNCN